jgi:hypothetical protein
MKTLYLLCFMIVSCAPNQQLDHDYEQGARLLNDEYPAISRAGIELASIKYRSAIDGGSAYSSCVYWRINKGRWLPLESRPELLSRFISDIDNSLEKVETIRELSSLLALILLTGKAIVIDQVSIEYVKLTHRNRLSSNDYPKLARCQPPTYIDGVLTFDAIDDFSQIWHTKIVRKEDNIVGIYQFKR